MSVREMSAVCAAVRKMDAAPEMPDAGFLTGRRVLFPQSGIETSHAGPNGTRELAQN